MQHYNDTRALAHLQRARQIIQEGDPKQNAYQHINRAHELSVPVQLHFGGGGKGRGKGRRGVLLGVVVEAS